MIVSVVDTEHKKLTVNILFGGQSWTAPQVMNIRYIPAGDSTVEPFVHGPTSASQSTMTDSSSAGGFIPSRKLASESHPIHSSSTASSSSANPFIPNTGPTGAVDSHPPAIPRGGKQRNIPAVPLPVTDEPVQNIDSGTQAIATQLPSRPVELPPVYSPV